MTQKGQDRSGLVLQLLLLLLLLMVKDVVEVNSVRIYSNGPSYQFQLSAWTQDTVGDESDLFEETTKLCGKVPATKAPFPLPAES